MLAERVWRLARDWQHSGRWPSRPENLTFEITAACDARCIHCPRMDMNRPMKAMAMPLFRRMIDEAAEMGVPYLCPNGYGEICTIPVKALEEYLAYIAGKKHRFKVVVNTNGSQMTDERIALFLKYRVHVVLITIDGATAATAESIRRNLKFERVEANVKRLLALRAAAGLSRPMVRVAMIAMPQTLPEIPMFFARWKGVADVVAVGGFTTRLGAVSGTWRAAAGADHPEQQDRPHACVLPFRDLNIWADGAAVICCEDWNAEQVAGDLNTQSLSAIWHSALLTHVRRQHMAHQGHTIDLCARCHNWHGPSRTARLWA